MASWLGNPFPFFTGTDELVGVTWSRLSASARKDNCLIVTKPYEVISIRTSDKQSLGSWPLRKGRDESFSVPAVLHTEFRAIFAAQGDILMTWKDSQKSCADHKTLKMSAQICKMYNHPCLKDYILVLTKDGVAHLVHAGTLDSCSEEDFVDGSAKWQSQLISTGGRCIHLCRTKSSSEGGFELYIHKVDVKAKSLVLRRHVTKFGCPSDVIDSCCVMRSLESAMVVQRDGRLSMQSLGSEDCGYCCTKTVAINNPDFCIAAIGDKYVAVFTVSEGTAEVAVVDPVLGVVVGVAVFETQTAPHSTRRRKATPHGPLLCAPSSDEGTMAVCAFGCVSGVMLHLREGGLLSLLDLSVPKTSGLTISPLFPAAPPSDESAVSWGPAAVVKALLGDGANADALSAIPQLSEKEVVELLMLLVKTVASADGDFESVLLKAFETVLNGDFGMLVIQQELCCLPVQYFPPLLAVLVSLLGRSAVTDDKASRRAKAVGSSLQQAKILEWIATIIDSRFTELAVLLKSDATLQNIFKGVLQMVDHRLLVWDGVVEFKAMLEQHALLQTQRLQSEGDLRVKEYSVEVIPW